MIALLCLISFFPLPSVTLAAEPSADHEYFEILKSIDLLGEVYNEVSKNYVDPVNTSELMYAGIDGMLRTLDPYSVFLDVDDSEELDEQTNGQYVGIGITLASLDGKFFITSVAVGHPAAKAGVKVGDHIIAINNKEITKLSSDDVKAQIKGATGTSMTLKLERQGVKPLTLTLFREEVRVNTVSYFRLIDGVGYIEMKSFGAHSADELREALQALQQQAREHQLPLKGVVLDLRNNPGGLLNAAVDVASLFLAKGSDVVSIRGRAADVVKSYVTERAPFDVAMPLVVLMNSESASAAEIVAGALQDLDRAVILGERSFGKGLVQSVVKISYDSSLKLTIAKYYTPSGRLIQKEVKRASGKRKVLPAPQAENASHVFTTKNGRKVYGGGGILPDITATEASSSPYLAELRKKGLLFLFARDYCAASPKKVPSRERELLMASFRDFLARQSFIYTTDAERRFKVLKEAVKEALKESMASALAAASPTDERMTSFSAVEQTIERLKKQEIAQASAEVAAALDVEILRHYDEQQARQAELDGDLAVKQAVALLSDSAKYNSTLQPPIPAK